MTTAGELQIFIESVMSIAERLNIIVSTDARFNVLSRNLENAIADELSADRLFLVDALWDQDVLYEFGDNVDRAYRELKEHCDRWLGSGSVDAAMMELYEVTPLAFGFGGTVRYAFTKLRRYP